MSIKTTGNERIDDATAEIAVYLRRAEPGVREQLYYDEAMRLRDEILEGAAELVAKLRGKPMWLHLRVNDPYGTPNSHPFWEGVNVELMGVYKLFERDGVVYAYDTRHNAWLHFENWAKAKQHCIKPPIDPWS